MKRFAMLVMALTLIMTSAAASANSWGLKGGGVLKYVSGTKAYNDYTAATAYYKKGVAASAAVMTSRYHNVLMAAHGDEVFMSTTALMQPETKEKMPELTCTDDTVTLTFQSGSTFTFTYRTDVWPEGFCLSHAVHGGVEMTLDPEKNQYVVNDHLVWYVSEPVRLEQFNLTLFPESEAQILHMNDIYAAMADASGFWNKALKGKKKSNRPVYSAPDRDSLRPANGKAAVDLRSGVHLMASMVGWDLVEYEVSTRMHRIGWIESGWTAEDAPVWMTDVPVTGASYLTDDPFVSQNHLLEGEALNDLHLMVLASPFYAYASSMDDNGREAWGFVPIDDRLILTSSGAEEAASEWYVGTWAFCGGGNVAPDVMVLSADGTGHAYGLTDEACMEDTYLAAGLTDDMLVDEGRTFTWRVIAQHSAVYGTDEQLVMTSKNGRVAYYPIMKNEPDEYGHDRIGLYEGEGGGGWARMR